MAQAAERAKGVFVRAYERVRFHRRERVSAHWRSRPIPTHLRLLRFRFANWAKGVAIPKDPDN